MIKEIIKDPLFLARRAKTLQKPDPVLIQDLKDTLHAHAHECVGMAANMIGVCVRVIIIDDAGKIVVMINPEIRKTSGAKIVCEEGCLCHAGRKQVTRFEKIKVAYLDEKWRPNIKTYTGFSAQIIQHEIDHCEGILI